MGIIEIMFIGLGLAMDAFAVSVCKGLSMKKRNWKNAIIIGLYFGIFQAVMPIIGYFLGTTFSRIYEWNHSNNNRIKNIIRTFRNNSILVIQISSLKGNE